MQVNLNGYGYCEYTGRVKSSEVKSNFEVERAKSDDVLSYYQKFCKEFEGISFRLDDLKEAAKYTDDVYLGYNNSHNQIGDNYGKIGQCSISLDASVVERMKNDPYYEERIKGLIQESYYRYSQYESDAVKDGYSYVSISIEDNNGVPMRGIQRSHVSYSTEEEVKKLCNSGNMIKKISLEVQNQNQQLFDSYMKMFDKSRKYMLSRKFD